MSEWELWDRTEQFSEATSTQQFWVQQFTNLCVGVPLHYSFNFVLSMFSSCVRLRLYLFVCRHFEQSSEFSEV